MMHSLVVLGLVLSCVLGAPTEQETQGQSGAAPVAGSTGNHPDTISNREVALEMLRRRIELATNEEDKKELIRKRDQFLRGRETVNALFKRILSEVTKGHAEDLKKMEDTHQRLSLEMMPCYEKLVENFKRTCVNINENKYTLSHMYKLANLCATNYSSTDDVLNVFTSVCNDEHRALQNID